MGETARVGERLELLELRKEEGEVKFLDGELPGEEMFAGLFALKVTGAKYAEPGRSTSAGGEGGVAGDNSAWPAPVFCDCDD